MNKVISFSLWGNNPKYTIGAIKNSLLAEYLYTGWECRFYVSDDVDKKIVDSLSKKSNIIKMSGSGWSSMLWRFYPLYDSSVDIFISRDTDSRLNYRERLAVDEWIASGRKLHVMRDHAYHGTPILGGMWGYRGTPDVDNIAEFISSKKDSDYYDVDQEFLRKYVYNEDDICLHDEIFNNRKFPSERQNNEYVGAPYNEHEDLEIQFVDIPYFTGVV